MALDIVTLQLAKKYTDAEVSGGGAIKGKNCVVSDISSITGGNRVTFQWTLDNGTVQTGTMDVKDGADGQDGSKGDTGLGIKAVAVSASNHLIVTYDDDTTEDAGEITNITTNIAHISDIDLDNLEDGQILKYNATTQKWENASAGSVDTDLVDLNDVDVDNLSDGQIIVWDATNSKWVNADNEATITIDPTPTSESENAVSSGGVYTALTGKVDVVSGKGLSTNDYDNTAKGIVDGVTDALATKQDKEIGKGLSTNDYDNIAKAAVDALGSVSTKDSTTYVNPGNSDIPTSNAVYQAMTSMLEGAFHPSGNKSVAELTSALLVQANVGNIYKITDNGTTDANWVGGAGQTITAGQMAVVVYGNTASTFLFNLENGINIDMSAYQTKAITPITVDGQTKNNVEDAVDAINVVAGSNKTAISGIKDGQSIDSFGDVETALADKADKVTSAVNGHLAGLNASGNLTDSGKSASDFADKAAFDDISYEYYIRNGLKNLVVINQESSTMNTITFTNNGDGTWTVNGTNSKSSSAYCFPMIVGPGYFKPGRYTLTGIPSGAENISLTLRYNGGSGNTTLATVNGSTPSVTFDLTAAQVAAATLNFNLMIGVPASAAVNNVTVSPMLVYEEVGSISSTFEKAGKTNKELEAEKLSLEANSILGSKNLLPNDASTTTINNVLYTVNSDGTINVSRTDTQTQISTMYISSITEDKYKTFAGKTLFMSGCPEGGSNDTYYLECYYNDGTEHWLRDTGNGLIIKFPATKPSIIRFLVGVKVATETLPTEAFKPMLTLMDYKDSEYTPHSMTNTELTQSVNDLKFSISQSVTLSTSAATTVTFTNAKITANSIVDLGFSEWGIFPDDVVCTSGVCTVTLPQVESAKTITVTLFLK